MGLTNNAFVNNFIFQGKLLYDEDIHNLMKMGIDFNKEPDNKKLILELMEDVRDNHTYINRIKKYY